MGSHESVVTGDAGAVLDAIRKLVRFLRLADTDAQATTGLSTAQLYILHQLADRPAASVDELSVRMHVDAAAVASVVDRLVRRGMVKRHRARELRLTPIAERVLRNAPSGPQEVIAQGVEQMSAPRRAELVRSLAILVAAIGADAVPARMLFEDEPVTPRRSRANGRGRALPATSEGAAWLPRP
jgi:DNA-binding MarR family transcriptional regulator